MYKILFCVALMIATNSSTGFSKQPCSNGGRIEGLITDPTGAAIPNATVQSSSGETATSDPSGHYVLSCVRGASPHISVTADGFAATTASPAAQAGSSVRLNVQMALASVETQVNVGDASGVLDADRGVNTRTLGATEVRQLADDPDDFQRQLQTLASVGGGLPGAAIITVDGFQNSSALPPKGSIASIRINPDMVLWGI